MDYGALPPEINSARMYLGPGSAPMLAAAAAWDGLAAELGRTASSYQSVIDELASEGWLGPASASMAAAVTPYMTWMSLTGLQAEHAAGQASAAAGAFEAAFAMTVPPAEVAANRAQLMALIATNFLGVNTPAIAAAEAQYSEMWAQDAVAMYGYAGSSAAASTLTPFGEPPQTTNPAGPVSQAAAVAQAAGTVAGTGTQDMLSQLTSTLPTALQGLASPLSSMSGLPGSLGTAASNATLAAPTPSGAIANILNFLSGTDGSPLGNFLNSNLFNGLSSAGYVNPAVIFPAVTNGMSNISGLQPGAVAAPGGSSFNFPAFASLHGPASVPGLGGVTAAPARSVLVGQLSVPQGWTAATQVANHAGAALPGGGWTSTAGPAPGAAGAVPAGVPGMPGMPGAGMGAHFGSGPRYGFRPTIMPRPPAAG
jgi:PPE-repeat protein